MTDADAGAIPVSANECAEIRRRRRTGETLAAIASDLGRTGATVSRHARGGERCPHDPEVVGVPVASNQPPWEGPVTAEECAEIRRRRRAGESVAGIADDLERGKPTISRHARGSDRCSHDPEEVGPPVAGRITAEVCADIRQRRREGETVAGIADDLEQTEATVSRHSLGDDGCNHDPEEVGPPVTGDLPRPPGISTEECAEIRQRRRNGETLVEVADTLNRSAAAVSRHATGAEECEHDSEEVGSSVTGRVSTGNRRTAISPPECAATRARRRAGQTLVEVADALDRSPVAVSRHARGGDGCDHDREVVGATVTGRTGGPAQTPSSDLDS